MATAAGTESPGHGGRSGKDYRRRGRRHGGVQLRPGLRDAARSTPAHGQATLSGPGPGHEPGNGPQGGQPSSRYGRLNNGPSHGRSAQDQPTPAHGHEPGDEPGGDGPGDERDGGLWARPWWARNGSRGRRRRALRTRGRWGRGSATGLSKDSQSGHVILRIWGRALRWRSLRIGRWLRGGAGLKRRLDGGVFPQPIANGEIGDNCFYWIDSTQVGEMFKPEKIKT